jgi:hypothetical protein
VTTPLGGAALKGPKWAKRVAQTYNRLSDARDLLEQANSAKDIASGCGDLGDVITVAGGLVSRRGRGRNNNASGIDGTNNIDADKIVTNSRKRRQILHEGRSIPASSNNAKDALNRKYGTIESAQEKATRVRQLPDGRTRYYGEEVKAKKPGPTRGSTLVTEHDPKTGRVRTWYENYDHNGNVNRVNPKSVNGVVVNSQHYPPTGSELGL